MSFDDVTDQFITYESRLASFHKNSKKRGSTASGRGTKAFNWPHKSITPASKTPTMPHVFYATRDSTAGRPMTTLSSST
ncbi:hypothetical protein LB505_000924 [Fusarium chuoi]|nr:hypothetical protein LB505_000924 [Fusarium chuoi]